MKERSQRRMCHGVRPLFILILVASAVAYAQAPATAVQRFDIPAQNTSDALNAFSKQSGLRLLFSYDAVEGRHTNAISGNFTANEVLRRLLAGTGLHYEVTADSVVLIRGAQTSSSTSTQRSSATAGNEGNDEADILRLAQSDPPSSSQDSGNPGAANDRSKDAKIAADLSSGALDEIIVTAQKRAERLIDVPQSISVLTADALAKLGATQFRDFATTVPGLSFTTNGPGFTTLTLRGVTTGTGASPTVGIYVDEVPYGSSTGFALGNQLTLDVGLFDLDRIEVLRGPQGTLYGASTMGGLLKYVTRRPDPERFGGGVQAGISDTYRGGVSHNIAAAVNAPIGTDKAAVRASGFHSHDGGYIHNLATGRNAVNRADISGGRLDLLLAPTEALTIRLTGFLQEIDREGQPVSDYAFSGGPVFGSLEQVRAIPETFEHRFRLGSATVNYDLERVALTSVSSYQTSRVTFTGDYTPLYLPLFSFLGRTYGAGGLMYTVSTDRFTEEVRLAANGERPLEWAIGGFYTREKSDNYAAYIFRDLAGQPAPNDLFTGSVVTLFEESAAFGDLTWHLTEQFDVTGGLRYARNRQTLQQTASGLFGRSGPFTRSTDDVFTYLANGRYRFNDHAIVYMRYATGYRPGGPNFSTIDATTGLPVGASTFEADKLKSYEAGFKAETADRRFGIDVAGYYIDWSNIQIGIARGGFAAVANAPGGAHVRGTELNLTARPTTGFTLSGVFSYQDAELSETDLNLGGAKGEQLPTVPRFNTALSADYELPISSWQPSIGATFRFVDERKNRFGAAAYRLPEYATIDLRAGFALDRVGVQFFVHNLLDERGQVSAIAYTNPQRVSITQPRTIGMTATTQF